MTTTELQAPDLGFKNAVGLNMFPCAKLSPFTGDSCGTVAHKNKLCKKIKINSFNSFLQC